MSKIQAIPVPIPRGRTICQALEYNPQDMKKLFLFKKKSELYIVKYKFNVTQKIYNILMAK